LGIESRATQPSKDPEADLVVLSAMRRDAGAGRPLVTPFPPALRVLEVEVIE
jgi:hypothetical protein